MDQSRRDAFGEGAKGDTRGACAPEKIPVVAHKRNHRRWLVTMDAETFFRFLRGEVEPPRHEGHQDGAQGLRRPTSEQDGGRSATRPTDAEDQRAEGGGQREFKQSGVPGGSPSTAGESPALPKTLSAAACAAVANENDEPTTGRGPTNTNETESQ